ncbi:MAG TPA: VTT domain-containing protein [Steroidobacteraceae bacterium]|nr:VTT domain-containing protein [Steroidobacteraceae bacterium]
MDWLHAIADLVLHLDRHLADALAAYHLWVYALLFFIVFAETGFVVTPFLPGDSLLFAAGALAAIDRSGNLRAVPAFLLLAVAASAGNSLNYLIGRKVGQVAFSGRYRWLRMDHLQRTHDYFERHGGLAVLLSRFVPIVRTFTPFVAGIARMGFATFQLFNVAGAVAWVGLLLSSGYLFGNLPWVKGNFGLVTLGIIAVSLAPLALVWWRDRSGARA